MWETTPVRHRRNRPRPQARTGSRCQAQSQLPRCARARYAASAAGTHEYDVRRWVQASPSGHHSRPHSLQHGYCRFQRLGAGAALTHHTDTSSAGLSSQTPASRAVWGPRQLPLTDRIRIPFTRAVGGTPLGRAAPATQRSCRRIDIAAASGAIWLGGPSHRPAFWWSLTHLERAFIVSSPYS